MNTGQCLRLFIVITFFIKISAIFRCHVLVPPLMELLNLFISVLFHFFSNGTNLFLSLSSHLRSMMKIMKNTMIPNQVTLP